MSTDSNIANEIDAIIARAMAEYSAAKGVDIFVPQAEEEPQPKEPQHEEIPANSKTVLIEETTSRFSSAIWFDNVMSKTITLAGLGGIGSYVAFLLARMHPQRIVLYDDDTVERANLSGQLFGTNHIGWRKCDAVTLVASEYADYYNTVGTGTRFTENSDPTNIMICGFDNMEARKIFFRAWCSRVASLPEDEKSHCLFIDGRLSAETLQVFCIKGDDNYNIQQYRIKYLFEDYEAEEPVCTYKQTSFMANMIGSIIANLFVNFCANECDPLIPRDLPFYTEYSAETMFFKVVA